MTNQAKHQLTNLAAEADYAKYKKHLGACVSTLVNATADSNEALANAKADLENRRQKRIARAARAGGGDDEGGEAQRSQEEIAQEAHVEALTEKVDRLTRAAEKAMRDLIDYTDELRAQDQLITGVVDQASQQVPPRARRARSGEGEDEDMPDADEDAAAILSPTEILKQARKEYQRAYSNRPMANRYSKNKDYTNFKELVHEAAGETEPLAPPTEWFGADGLPRDRRSRNAADHTSNGGQDEQEEEEDLVLVRGVTDTKCPITLQTFKEPVGNHSCKHVFEKGAIMEMLSKATVFYEGGGGRNRRGPGVKKLKCPTSGCEKMLEEKDFFDDHIMKRQVKRQLAAEAREAERAQEGGEESEEDVHGKSQKNTRRETLDLDQMRIKKERMAKMESQSDDG